MVSNNLFQIVKGKPVLYQCGVTEEMKHQINCLRTLRRKISTKFSPRRLLDLQQAQVKLQQQIINAQVN